MNIAYLNNTYFFLKMGADPKNYDYNLMLLKRKKNEKSNEINIILLTNYQHKFLIVSFLLF